MNPRTARSRRRLVRRDLPLFVALSACVGGPLDLGQDRAALTLPVGPVVVVQDGTTTNLVVGSTLLPSESLQNVEVSFSGGLSSAVTVGAASYHGTSATVPLNVATPSDPPVAQTYPTALTVTATSSDGRLVSQQTSDVVIAVEASISASNATSEGVGGRFEEFLGTSFQPADWQSQFFDAGTSGPDEFTQRKPRHVLIQLMNGGAIPLVGSSGTASDWDFHELDAIVKPVLASGAQVELQIAVIPPVIQNMGLSDQAKWNLFAEYCRDLVLHYNSGSGFTWGDAGASIPPLGGAPPIQWWGIYSDFNQAPLSLTPSQYAALYTTAVDAMRAADPSIQFSAFEFNDLGLLNSQDSNPVGPPYYWLEDSLGPVLEAGAPVDAVSLHWFATHVWSDSDSTLFDEVATPAPGSRTFAQDLAQVIAWVDPPDAGPDASTIPVWVTENNVNSDYPTDAGTSGDNGGPFANDPRGTNAFFAAWRPYVFSTLGKEGSQGLIHWDFTSGRCPPTGTYCIPPGPGVDATVLDTDVQNAEVDYTTGQPYLSYWVDSWLAQMFTPPPGAGWPKILEVTKTETSAPPSVEVLATQNDDGTVAVMAIDLAPDPNQPISGGDPRTVVLDFANLLSGTGVGSYQVETLLLDATTLASSPDAATAGPPELVSAEPIGDSAEPTSSRLTLTFNGYGVEFVKLTP